MEISRSQILKLCEEEPKQDNLVSLDSKMNNTPKRH
jgi:hypothetical protein